MTISAVSSAVVAVLGCLAVAGVVFASPAARPADQAKVTKHLEAGEEALQGGEFEKAISAFKKADKVSGGSSVRALIGLATAHLELEHYQEVARVTDQAHALAETSSDQAQLYHLVGSAYWGLAKEIIKKQQYEVIRDEEEATRLADLIIQAFAAAEDRFRKALELSEGDIEDSWFSLAWVLITQGRLAEGQAALEEYLEQVPEEERAQGDLRKIKVARESRDAREKARALEEQDHLEEARAVLKGYLERHPVSIGVEFQLRRLDLLLEDSDESRCHRQIASYTSIGEISVTYAKAGGSNAPKPSIQQSARDPNRGGRAVGR